MRHALEEQSLLCRPYRFIYSLRHLIIYCTFKLVGDKNIVYLLLRRQDKHKGHFCWRLILLPRENIYFLAVARNEGYGVAVVEQLDHVFHILFLLPEFAGEDLNDRFHKTLLCSQDYCTTFPAWGKRKEAVEKHSFSNCLSIETTLSIEIPLSARPMAVCRPLSFICRLRHF